MALLKRWKATGTRSVLSLSNSRRATWQSGPRPAKGLLRRARTLVASAKEQWGPMLSLALELKDAFGSRSSLGARYDDDELDDDEFEADEDLDDRYEDDDWDAGDSIEDPSGSSSISCAPSLRRRR